MGQLSSLAGGRFATESDIDLAVAGIAPDQFFAALAALNRLTARWVDLKLWESLEPHFCQRVLETGEVLYARDGLLALADRMEND